MVSIPRLAADEKKIYQEITAISCLFLGTFLFLSLLSYVLPVFASQAILPTAEENWCGGVGFYTAFYLFSFVGVISFFPVLLLFYVAVAVFTVSATLDRLPYIIAGGTGTLLAASGLLAGAEQILFPANFILPGGYLGDLLRSGLEGILGAIGSVLILVLVLIFSLMASIRFSPVASALWFWEQMPLVLERVAAGREWTGEKIITWKEERRKRLAEQPAPLKINPPVTALTVLQTEKKVPEKKEKKTGFFKGALKGGFTVHEPVKRETGMEADNDEFAAKPSAVRGEFQLPPVSLLNKNTQGDLEVDRQLYYTVSEKLVAKLADFAVKGEVVGVSPGPVVTTYEFAPAAGVKINKVVNLADDLAMVLKVDRVRVVGSIPGKAAIGIEIPNPERKTVFFRDILLSNAYRNAASFLTVALGFDVIGRPAVANLAKMPHLLIAGATGAGKSVAINAFICSILYKATPETVRLLMIDPKRIELSVYEGIPHLLHPVVVEPKMASRALLWAVRE
ncbi:MAG: DNA translocase FtsK, partial [Candidatus Electrothrix sp. AUS1_2]|nr:DNA translocase FtsK [Candidatus Electrothrix sp. AUS1_2]